MQEKLKILTIGDYESSTLENYFKDSKNIEFLELTLNEGIEKLNSKLFNREKKQRRQFRKAIGSWKSFKRKRNYYNNYFRRKAGYGK